MILGCTEIGMLIDDSVSPIPTYDTTELHAKALVQAGIASAQRDAKMQPFGSAVRGGTRPGMV